MVYPATCQAVGATNVVCNYPVTYVEAGVVPSVAPAKAVPVTVVAGGL